MTPKSSYLSSTIGRKQIVGVTGLALSLFVLTHMLGNLLILVSAQKYNEYAHALTSNPLLIFAELGLLAMFVMHMGLAMRTTIKNFSSRTQGYAVSAKGPKATDPVSKSMWAQGLIILVFTIVHLINFKWGVEYQVNYGQGPIRDLHKLVVESFNRPEYVCGYIFALVVLGLHLSHGLKSSFQTLGLHHPSYQPLIKKMSWAYAAVVSVGFISQPLYVFFIYKG